MPREVVGKIPEFTDEATPEGEQGVEEVKKVPPEKVEEEEKVTPAEPPAEKKPAEEAPPEEAPPEEAPSVGIGEVEELKKQVEGLGSEREKLLSEIRELRGTRREIKEEKLKEVEKKIDELKDIHPEDKKVIDRIVKAGGYLTKEDAERMIYNQVKQSQLDAFLVKHPEYKPENDPDDINWKSLQRELAFYRLPTNPHRINEVLEKAHRVVSQHPSERISPEVKKKRLETAGVGAGGAQRSSSRKALPAWMKEEYRRGGWSEEEIKEMEKKYEPE